MVVEFKMEWVQGKQMWVFQSNLRCTFVMNGLYIECIDANTPAVIRTLTLQGAVIGANCLWDPQALSVLILTSACGFIMTSEEIF